MTITTEEFNKIVFEVTEAILLRMPEVLGNLIQEHAVANKMNKKFYESHPEFKSNISTVRSVVEQVESENTSLEYKEILDKATPLIKERIKLITSSDIENKPAIGSLNFNAESVDSNGIM